VIGLIDATGSGLFATVSTLFFTRVVGLPVGQVGLGLSLAGLAALLGAIPLGSLGDRLGHRRVWITVTLAEALACACYPLVHSSGEFTAAVTLAALGQVGSSPIRAAYLAPSAAGGRPGAQARHGRVGTDGRAAAGDLAGPDAGRAGRDPGLTRCRAQRTVPRSTYSAPLSPAATGRVERGLHANYLFVDRSNLRS
jgi:MFS family permease